MEVAKEKRTFPILFSEIGTIDSKVILPHRHQFIPARRWPLGELRSLHLPRMWADAFGGGECLSTTDPETLAFALIMKMLRDHKESVLPEGIVRDTISIMRSPRVCMFAVATSMYS
jgi:hypothetical protein